MEGEYAGTQSASNCYLERQTDLYLDFTVPLINRTLHLIEADAFDLMHKEDNKTCRIHYTGPQIMIVSTISNCVFSLNIKQPIRHDLIISPSHGCLASTEFTSENKYFSIEKCEKQRKHDESDLTQIKPFHGSHHIYCPGSNIEIDGKPFKCPDGVFLVPMGASFKINDFQYHGTQVYLDHKEEIDPLFTMKANWILQPSLNLSELRQHPLLKRSKEHQFTEIHYTDHPMTWTTIGMTGLLLLLISALIIYVGLKQQKRKKPLEFRVVARRIESDQENVDVNIEDLPPGSVA